MARTTSPGQDSVHTVSPTGPPAENGQVVGEEVINVLVLVDKFDYHGSYLNGPTRYFSWFMERLDRTRFHPTLCALRGRGRSDQVFRALGIEVVYLGAAKWNPLVLLSILRLIRERDIDLLHLTGYGSTTFGRLAGGLCGKPVILHEHWVDPNFGWLHRAAELVLSPLSAKAIAISEYARSFLVQTKGLDPEDVVVIRNGIPLEAFWEATERDGLAKREALGVPVSAPVVGTVGMLHENKGYHHLLEAASRLRDRWPEAVFVLVGDGEERVRLEAQARRLGLEGTVRFLGHQDEIPSVLAMMDVWAMTSLSETAPLSLLEAMAAGKAIVTTDCGGPSEIVEDGHSGRVVPPGDPERLADAIDELLGDPERRSQLGTEARRVSRRFGIDEMVRSVEELYADVVETGVQPAA